jgi:hypothetical protein
MVDALNTQRVNAAVHVAVRRAISEMPTVGNRQALEFSIGRRLQGTYGAALRALAEADPDLSVAELAEQVIFVAEYADDIPEASIYSGARDHVRAQRYGPFLEDHDESLADAVIWCAGILAAQASVADEIVKAPLEPPNEPDPEFAARMALARACADPSRGAEALAELRRRTGAA